MRLNNTSRYPDDEIRRLVEFGMTGINTVRVAVNVKNATRKPYGGRAYRGVPSISPVKADYLVTLHIGAPGMFPCTNEVTSLRWLPWETTREEAERIASECGGVLTTEGWYPPSAQGVHGGIVTARWSSAEAWARTHAIPEHLACQPHLIRYGVVVTHPYGGKRSPLIEMATWQEAMVAIAAHEARHIHQFRHGKPASEIDCERFARKALERFRAEAA
jgi:hypothetical protein